MTNKKSRNFWIIVGLLFAVTACSPLLVGQHRFQIEIYGGLSYLSPGDLNLFSRAEEQYNQLLYIERHLGWQGYFINDFPRISNAVPAGFRVKYRISEKFAVSVEAEGFRRTQEASISGSFSYASGWSLTEAKDYAPYRLSLKGLSVMGGLHYRFNAWRSTELEVGVAGGWARAEFDFRSTWTYSIELIDPDFIHISEDGGTLEGDGRGDGFAAKGMLRLNHALGRRFGFFVETSATYCRLKSISGNGRETRLGIPGETTWEGPWGIKREDIEVSWGSDAVFVPTNYWEGWTAAQRERDFILNLSSLRLILGVYIRL
jgi:opacity protein-like surface antigen